VSREKDLALPGMPGRIAGYRLERYIGRGCTGVVYLARDERLGRKAAVKVVAPELARDAAFRTRFLRESQEAAVVGHPHIIPVYQVGEEGGIVYLAMRYARGGDARSLVSRLGPLGFARAWSIIAQVASALDAAHGHGLIHRGVKPASMLLDASAAGGRTPGQAGDDVDHVYLSDFGMSMNPPRGQTAAAGQFAGALDYLAPEQIQGRALDGHADLYSLACAGFELLCGTPPFGQDQGVTVMYDQLYVPPPAATARRPDLPAAVDLVLARALAKSPADRHATCGQFAEELRMALGLRLDEQHESGHEPAQAPAPAPPGAQARQVPRAAGPGRVSPDSVRRPGEPDPQQPRRRPGAVRLILAVAATAIVAAAVAAGVAHTSRPAPGTPAISSPAASSAPSSSAPSPSASASTLAWRQAAAVNKLLGSSTATRKALQNAVSQIGSCTNLSGAVSMIQDVVGQRTSQYNQASALPTTTLPSGTIVKSDLITALRDSLNADRDYLTWAQQQLNTGCTPTAQSSAYNAAYHADQQADAAKETFAQVWNPVAARYGLQPSPSSI
jgi:serine/threonine protein kinase